jgi:hypothetical protein
VRSPWREFEFCFMLVRNAIVPRLSLERALGDWPRIRRDLMENARKRKLQIDYLPHVGY